MSRHHISDLAEAVTDGDTIDWRAVQARLTDADDHRIATELHHLSRMHAVAPWQMATSQRRLPLALEFARLLAIGCAASGAGIELIGATMFDRTGHVVFAIVLLAFVGGAVYLDLGGRDRRTRALASCYWMVAASFSVSAFRWLTMQAADAAWLRILTAVRPESLFAASLWQFAREFPTVTRFGRLDRLCLIALRITLPVGVGLLLANVVIGVAPLSAASAWLAPFNGVTAQVWYWNIVFGVALPALVVIGFRTRYADTQEERRARLFLWAIMCAFAPVILEVLAEGLFPSYRRIVRTPFGQLVGGLVIYPAQIALPLVTAYAVVVDNVLEVRVMVQRGLRYLLARALVVWGAAIPVAALILYIYRHRDEPLSVAVAAGQARTLVWIAIVAVVLLLFRQSLARALDRWALPGIEDGATTLARMTDLLKNTRTPIEVVTVFAEATESALQAPTEGYVMRDHALAPLNPSGTPPPAHSLIRVLLEGARVPCVVAPDGRSSYYSLVTHDDRRWIIDEEIAVLVPVMSGRGRGGLVGMIALKNRRNALTFTPNDLRFLSAGSASATLASDLLEAESHPPMPTSVAEVDELAIECASCGCVARWMSGEVDCVCGGRWRRAVLPQRVAQRFEITRLLGAGGMGVVYRATDVTLHRDVAIKTLPRLSDDAAERLLEEARTMAALSHGNIATLYGAEMWRGTPLLVMEYLRGGTLAARLRGAPLPVAETLTLVHQLALTLEHLHSVGLYHGDIKPSNIGFASGGTPKFLDFGVSRAIVTAPHAAHAAANAAAAHRVAGTLPYLSPEVLSGAIPGPALDIWALSIVACECVIGSHPFSTAMTTDRIADRIAAMVTDMRSSLPKAFCDFVERALSPQEHRYPMSAGDFARELVRLQGGLNG